MLRLVVVYEGEERVLPVPEGVARLGSAPENDFAVRVPGVSRRHAMVRRVPGGVEVVDLGSKNGLFVEGKRVERALLTPGLRLQIGMAWLEIEEVSSSEVALASLIRNSSVQPQYTPYVTATVLAKADPRGLSPVDRALALAYHIAEVGVGLPGTRTDLLARIKATLDAGAFVSFELRRRGKLRVLDSEGKLSQQETKLLSSLGNNVRPPIPGQIVVKRAERILVAGREAWFVGASFAEETMTQERWRKDLLRFLAHKFFAPVRNLDDVKEFEAHRLLALVGGKKRTAGLLGISRSTLDKLLARHTSPKP